MEETNGINIISAALVPVDHGGNQFSVNYCARLNSQRHCSVREDHCLSKVSDCAIGFVLDDRNCTHPSCTCSLQESLGQVHFGDIIMDEVLLDLLTDINGRAADTSVTRWNNIPSGDKFLVPYSLSRMPVGAHSSIYAGIKMLEAGSCLKFVQRANQRDYLKFYQGGGCSSPVGRQGGAQYISLGSGCWYAHTVAHEIMHSLGFWHEQMRPDRDSAVYVNLNNVSPNMRYNFNMIRNSKWNSFGQAYDIHSVMQYNGHAFSANGQVWNMKRRNIR